MATDIAQECGEPTCPYYGHSDEPGSKAEDCPDEHIKDRHPGFDPEWRPSTYRYMSSMMQLVETTQQPIDDESALTHFHRASREFGDVMFVLKAEPGSDKFTMLPYRFVDGSVEKL